MIWSTFGRRWAALPTGTAAGPLLKSYFDTLYVALTGNQTVAGVKTFSSNPVVSGGAIQFPATQVPSADANALDDYEEGTWTPGISFGNGTTGLTYTVQTGSYTKIGRAVLLQGHVALSAKGSSTGQARITGLPFSAAGIGTITIGYFGNMASLVDGIICLINGSAATTGDLRTGNAATAVAMTEAHFTNTSDLYFTSKYFV
jgi:hypothetical protein